MNNKARYRTMELILLVALVIDLILFIAFLIASGNGIVWMKVLFSILTIAISVLCLLVLYKTGELLKQRSLWMSTAAAAILICLLFSLLLNFPSPNPYSQIESEEIGSSEKV